MKKTPEKIVYILSVSLYTILSALFVWVLCISVNRNLVDMVCSIGLAWRAKGNYCGFFAGIIAYLALMLISFFIPRLRHNLNWLMKFTHELTHTLMALVCGGKIREFVVRDRECYVSYKAGSLSYLPITLSPYCIPIYTLMIFPFRFAGNDTYMIFFDCLITFTYMFHLHTYVKQTRPSQSDISNCGLALSASFISFVHLAMLSLIVAIPKGGLLNAISRVFWKYPAEVLDKIMALFTFNL